jgi:hypothetical protein
VAISQLEIHVEIEIIYPLKAKDKKSFYEDLRRLCTHKGAENFLIDDSHYWYYKWPDKPKLFEVIIKIRCNVKTVIKICDALVIWFRKYENRPRIWIEEKSGVKSEFKKLNNKKGVIRIMSPTENTDIGIGTKGIEIIPPSKYGD